jgi:acetyl esterase/lipase
MSSMPENLRREIASIGPNFNDDVNMRVRKLYAPLIPPASPETSSALDLSYGTHPRQRLDVYYRKDGGKKKVMLYVPGGGFVAGDKRSDDRFYGNIGRWFAEHGVVCFTMNYRLAPDAVWPAGGRDVRDATAYIKAHAAEYGGDPDDFTIFGQSAGAAHVTAFLFHPEIQDPSLKVTRAVLASGTYDPPAEHTPPNIAAYYGSDPSLYAHRAPINHVANSSVPLMLSYSEFDPPFLAEPTLQLAQAVMKRDRKSPKLFYLEGHNHVSNVLSFGTEDETFGREILGFMDQRPD